MDSRCRTEDFQWALEKLMGDKFAALQDRYLDGQEWAKVIRQTAAELQALLLSISVRGEVLDRAVIADAIKTGGADGP